MIEVLEQVSLATHTTLKVGGPAQYFVAVTSEAELAEAVSFAHAKNLPIKILGGGSNVLVSDTGVPGLVIHNQIAGITVGEEDTVVHVTVGAGENFDALVARCVQAGWWGIENLSHIPGTVGATPVQNVGAYGVEVKDVITAVRVYDTDRGAFRELSNTDCQFGYRDSLFKQAVGQSLVVVSVTFRLTRQPTPRLAYRDLAERFAETVTPSLSEIRDAIIAIRAAKFPNWHEVGTAGSFFKNPIVAAATYDALKKTYPELPGYELSDGRVKLPLGWIFDKVLQLKGVSAGSVGTYAGQALVLVTNDDATAAEINAFADTLAQKVLATTGVTIEWEVTRW